MGISDLGHNYFQTGGTILWLIKEGSNGNAPVLLGKMNKDKHSNHWHEQGKNICFSLSIDGMLGKEALVVLQNLSILMSAKLEERILHVRGWVNSQIVIVVLRYYYRMIYRACIPSLLWDRDPDWELGSGLGLAQKLVRQNSFAHTRRKLFCLLPDLEFTPISLLRNSHTTCVKWAKTASGGLNMGNDEK